MPCLCRRSPYRRTEKTSGRADGRTDRQTDRLRGCGFWIHAEWSRANSADPGGKMPLQLPSPTSRLGAFSLDGKIFQSLQAGGPFMRRLCGSSREAGGKPDAGAHGWGPRGAWGTAMGQGRGQITSCGLQSDRASRQHRHPLWNSANRRAHTFVGLRGGVGNRLTFWATARGPRILAMQD